MHADAFNLKYVSKDHEYYDEMRITSWYNQSKYVSDSQNKWFDPRYPGNQPLTPGVTYIYEPSNGQMNLVGVEFIVDSATWLKNNANPPVLEGQTFQFVDSPNRFNIPSFFELHVWAWRSNPKGSFMDWNDNVTCAGQ